MNSYHQGMYEWNSNVEWTPAPFPLVGVGRHMSGATLCRGPGERHRRVSCIRRLHVPDNGLIVRRHSSWRCHRFYSAKSLAARMKTVSGPYGLLSPMTWCGHRVVCRA